jgi:hypothetical protein
MLRIAAMLALCSLPAVAGGVDGTWRGTVDTPNGSITRTFLFKTDGNRLTGETSSQMGKSTIADGKIDGDTITFTISIKFQDNDLKLHYKGKVSGDEIKFTVEAPEAGQTLEYTAKRIQ